MNWSEPAIDAHPDEAARIVALTARIVELDANVTCLQEVSGDQLASLRAALPEHTFHVHTYPRVPKPFRPAEQTSPLVDPTEQLVTITRGVVTRRTSSETFPTDKGKGFLLVELIDELAIINTHVSYGDNHPGQLQKLTSVSRSYPAVVIVGDFNDDRACCRKGLGETFRPAIPIIDKPTRPRSTPSSKSEVIDHVFISGCTATDVEVLPGRGLSDHNPIAATIER